MLSSKPIVGCVNVPLRVSHRSLLGRVRPLGRAWNAPNDPLPPYAFRAGHPSDTGHIVW